MRSSKLILFIPIAMLYLAAPANAAPTVVVGNYDLLPNTPGQTIVLNVTGIVPGTVFGVDLPVAIDEGGLPYGGTPGPSITAIDVDSGPSIWVLPQSPGGHQPTSEFVDGQIAVSTVLTVSGFVNVTNGILATLVVDTTGFGPGIHKLTLSGAVNEILPDAFFYGSSLPPTTINYQYFDGTGGQITIVPEPSSLILGALGLIAWGWRRKRWVVNRAYLVSILYHALFHEFKATCLAKLRDGI